MASSSPRVYRRPAAEVRIEDRRHAATILHNPERLPIVVVGPNGEPIPVGRVARVIVPLHWYRLPPSMPFDPRAVLQQFLAFVAREYRVGTLFDDVVTAFDFPERPGADEWPTGFFGAVSFDFRDTPEMCLAGPGLRPSP